MEQLAERYAKLKGTKVIATWIHENSITFVLESGPKLTMSTRELEEAIAKLEAELLKSEEVGSVGSPSTASLFMEAPPEVVAKPKPKKGKPKS